MKNCVIRQGSGLGDILFTYKIAKKIIETKKADHVYWPVIKNYEYISEYLRSDKISFVEENKDFPGKHLYHCCVRKIINTSKLLYIPLKCAHLMIPYKSPGIQYVKYELANSLVEVDYSDWADHIDFKRNYEREKELEDYLQLPDNFTIFNKNLGSKPPYTTIDSIPKLDNAIEFKSYQNSRIFDWLGILEKAKEIHTVETSLCFILAILKKENVFVYPRKPRSNQSKAKFELRCPPDYSYIRDILPKTWKYII